MESEKEEKTTKVEKPEVTDLIPLEFIRSEVNLLILPFFALTTKGLKNRLRTEFRAVAEREGERIEILWNVSANPEYGYPGLFDRQVHRAVEQIITEILHDNGQVENPIPLGSLYSLCQRMGQTPSKDGTYSGRVYRAIKKALERIATTAIKSEGTFYHKGEQHWVSEVFHLYDAVVFQGKRLRDGRIADTNYLYLSDLYLQSLNAFYVKPLDYHYQRSLRSPIASRLYEILGVKFFGVRHYRQAEVCFRYSTLAQLLPVERYEYLAHAKKQLNPAHDELVKTSFLASYEWHEAREEGDWLIFYRPGPRALDEIQRALTEHRLRSVGPQETLPGLEEEFEPTPVEHSAVEFLSEEEEVLVAELMRLHVSEATARQLVKHSDPHSIRQWMEALPYTRAQDKAAFLVKAIQENWQVPEEYLKAKEDEKERARQQQAELLRQQQEREAEQRRQQEAEQLDRLYESLSARQRGEIDREVEARVPAFLRTQIAQQRQQGTLGVASAAILQTHRRQVLQEWLAAGKLKPQQGKKRGRSGQEA